MNRSRMLFLAAFALVLSAILTFFAYNLLKSRFHTPQERRIVVAAKRLALGMRLTENDLRFAPWPHGISLEGSFNTVQEVVGRGVIVSMLPNEPVLESKLAPRQGGAGLTSAIPPGMRAVSVKVNDVIGVAGFVLPGTRVDVILSGSPDDNGDTDTSRVILENVQVLAAGQNVEQDMNGRPQNVQVVTLLVTPEETQKLALAIVDGRIQLALRNPMDLQREEPAPVQKAALYGRPTPVRETQPPAPQLHARRQPAPQKDVTGVMPSPPPATFVVELIQGDKRATSTFETEHH